MGRLIALLLLTFSCWLLPVKAYGPDSSQPPKPCPQSSDFYQGYVVKDVRIKTPLSVPTPLAVLLGAGHDPRQEFKAALARLPLQGGDIFERGGNHSASVEFLGRLYGETDVRPGEKIKISFVTYKLEDCDEAARTMDVVYLVYTSETFYYASRVFEHQPDKIDRTLSPKSHFFSNSARSSKSPLSVQPYVGYDAARNLFSGTHLSFQPDNGVVNRIDTDVSGSSTSATARSSLGGSKQFDKSWLSHVDWRAGYDYSNMPSDALALKGGTGFVQLFGASAPLGSKGVIVRFGGSLEGGNRQTDLKDFKNIPLDAAQTRYGAAKLYVGSTLNHGRQSWTASYGLQLGNHGNGLSLDYTKHIFDVGYRTRLLLGEHKSLRVESRLSAGTIKSAGGPVPIVERFFGGNGQRNFIQGDDWVINSGPLIRSFASNSLNRVGPDSPIGGRNFFSANLTLSHPVWRKPLVASDISSDKEIMDMVGNQLRLARQKTMETYLADEPNFVAVANSLLEDIRELQEAIKLLPKAMVKVLSQNPPPSKEVRDIIGKINEDDLLKNTKDTADMALCDRNRIKVAGVELNLGHNETDPPRPALVTALSEALSRLAVALDASDLKDDSGQFQEAVEKLNDLQKKMVKKALFLKEYGAIKVETFESARAILKNDGVADDMPRALKKMAQLLPPLRESANNMPHIGRTELLDPDDLAPIHLTKQLRDAQDPLSEYLKTQLPAEVRELVEGYKDNNPLPEKLPTMLLGELNRLIGGGESLYDEDRFSKVDLTEETEKLAESQPTGKDLIRLNRSLLAEAYPNTITKSKFDEMLEPLDGYLELAASRVDVATKAPDKVAGDAVRNSVHELAVGYGPLAPSLVTRINAEVRALTPTLTANDLDAEAQKLAASAARLVTLQKEARRAFNAVTLPDAERKTERDMSYSAGALDVIFRELNLVELSPTLMLDAARIGPAAPGFGGVRYGVGPGLRFSLLSLDLTVGYSFNLHRRAGEGRGAFGFSMNISDLIH